MPVQAGIQFFDAISCRQESRVYITFKQITCFFYTQVFFFFPIFFFSVFSFLKFVTLASTTQMHHPIYFLCTCHACAGRYPVILTHSAAGRKVEFALHSNRLLGLSVFVFSFLFFFFSIFLFCYFFILVISAFSCHACVGRNPEEFYFAIKKTRTHYPTY